MIRNFRSISLAIIFASISTLLFPLSLTDEQKQEFDSIVEKGIEDKLYPGGVLIFGSADEIIYSKAYGKQTYAEDSTPVELNTIYDMASVSKVVGTAAMALHLIENGTLDLNEKVTDTLPAFAANEKDSVTIHDLLTHTSGLKAYASYKVADEKRAEDETHAQALINHYCSLDKRYETRKDFTYSCLNFQTLAYINEQKAGVDMENYLTEKVYSKIGMDDTHYNVSDAKIDRVAPTHRKSNGTDARQIHDPLARYHGSNGRMPGNAGLFSTAPDLAIFCQMVLNHGTLNGVQAYKPETIKDATSIHTPLNLNEHRGLGFDVYEGSGYITDFNLIPGHHVIGHSGYTGTLFLIDQHTEKFMVFVTNRTYPSDPEGVDQTTSITPVRKELWSTFMHLQPEYQDYFAAEEKAETKKVSSNDS